MDRQTPAINPFIGIDKLHSYREETFGIEIVVTPEYLPRQSRPSENVYTYAYHVDMTNKSEQRVQLLSRHWKIIDGNQRAEEVFGSGVIGEQPILLPGQVFRYSSGCPLKTPTGNMRGWYDFLDLDTKKRFRVKIPLFFLRGAPPALH